MKINRDNRIITKITITSKEMINKNITKNHLNTIVFYGKSAANTLHNDFDTLLDHLSSENSVAFKKLAE